MEGLGAEDEAVMGTNCDATECKLAAVQLGYWCDEYVGLFVRGGERRAPEINRGYYARVRAVELFVDQFLEVTDPDHCMSRHQYCYLLHFNMPRFNKML